MKKIIFKQTRKIAVGVAKRIGARMEQGKATDREQEIRKQLMNWTVQKTKEIYN